MKERRLLAGLAAAGLGAAMLAACGGGGGGGGSETTVSLTNVQVPTIADEVYENGTSTGTTLPPFAVTADLQGDVSSLSGKTIYIVVDDPDGFVRSASVGAPLKLSGNTLIVQTRVYGPPPGRYRSGFVVKVCLDAACTRQLGGSPISVPYDVTVLPGLVINANQPVELSSVANVPVQKVVPLGLPAGLQNFPAGPLPMSGQPWVEKVDMSFAPMLDWAIDLGATPVARVEGKATAAGAYSNNLILFAQVKSPKGRLLRLEAQVPVRYTVGP